MPYKSVKDLPTGAKNLSKAGQHIFMAAFNNCAKSNKGGDEGTCFRIAYSAARKAKGDTS